MLMFYFYNWKILNYMYNRLATTPFHVTIYPGKYLDFFELQSCLPNEDMIVNQYKSINFAGKGPSRFTLRPHRWGSQVGGVRCASSEVPNEAGKEILWSTSCFFKWCFEPPLGPWTSILRTDPNLRPGGTTVPCPTWLEQNGQEWGLREKGLCYIFFSLVFFFWCMHYIYYLQSS